MNKGGDYIQEYRALQFLDEISRNKELTQRDLSLKFGVALGLVNSYIKNLVSKGYITVSAIPRKRYRYYLTPDGFAEKMRLTLQHLQNFTNLYRVARRDYQSLFAEISRTRARRVLLCGLDEITEIAYLSMRDTSIELVGVLSDKPVGKDFFGHRVYCLDDVAGIEYDLVVITSFGNGAALRKSLLDRGVEQTRICDIGADGWIERLLHNAQAEHDGVVAGRP